MLNIFNVSGSAISAQSQRLNVVASNLANADTVADVNGKVYKARQVQFQTQNQTQRQIQLQTPLSWAFAAQDFLEGSLGCGCLHVSVSGLYLYPSQCLCQHQLLEYVMYPYCAQYPKHPQTQHQPPAGHVALHHPVL